MALNLVPRKTRSLPIEILHQITLYLPKRILRTLLQFQPHVIGQVASYVFFSELSLYFGIRYEGDVPDLEWSKWHNKRSYEILMHIIADRGWAKRVRMLKIYVPDVDHSDILETKINMLDPALLKLTSLRILECNGLLLPLLATIASLSTLVPQLESLRLCDGIVNINFPNYGIFSFSHERRVQTLLSDIDWKNHFWSHISLRPETFSMIKKIHIKSFTKIMTPFISPAFIQKLTHIFLNTWLVGSLSPFELALKYGVNLRSLRIKGAIDPAAGNGQIFRRYAHALPHLIEFGIYIDILDGASHQPSNDEDFFPAVCDFIALKAAQIVHLELRAPESQRHQTRLGFYNGCWRMFKMSRGVKMPFPRLESLSMTLLPGRRKFATYYSRLIPRGVTTLTLSGEQSPRKLAKFFALPRSKHVWPPNLRLITITSNVDLMDDRVPISYESDLVKSIAACMPTVTVVKMVNGLCLLKGLWTILWKSNSCLTDVEKDAELCVNRWSWREMTVLKEEMLQKYGCCDTWFEN